MRVGLVLIILLTSCNTFMNLSKDDCSIMTNILKRKSGQGVIIKISSTISYQLDSSIIKGCFKFKSLKEIIKKCGKPYNYRSMYTNSLMTHSWKAGHSRSSAGNSIIIDEDTFLVYRLKVKETEKAICFHKSKKEIFFNVHYSNYQADMFNFNEIYLNK